MTRKGLAFGAGLSLVLSGFAGVPASAAGLADTSFVSLSPTTGTEYTVLASNSSGGATFSLKANEAATVSVGNLKFLVTDPNSLVEPTAATTARTLTLATSVAVVRAATTGIVTVTVSNNLAAGDLINLSGDLTNANATVAVATDGPFTVLTASASAFTFDATASGTTAVASAVLSTARTVAVLREARDTTAGTFVVDSGVSSAATDETLVLKTVSNDTRSVTVVAWMDANGNDKVDSTEYASPVRTITWIKASEVVALTTLSPIVGDLTLSAKITTTPVLNGEQTLAFNLLAVNASFTRSLSTSTGLFGQANVGLGGNQTAVWNNTSKQFTVAVNVDANATDKANAVAGSGTVQWADLDAPVAGGTNLASLAISTTGRVTAVTTADHKLVSGDKITMIVDAGQTTLTLAAEAAGRTVTVTGAKSFTYQVSETTGFPATAVATTNADNTTDYVVVTYDGNTGLVDRVGAETYSARAFVMGVANGAIATTGVNSAVAATTTIETVSSSSVQGLSFDDVNAANDIKVLAGTLSVPVTITVTNSSDVAVGAGRAVALSFAATGPANTVRINGKTADTVLTDANGQVTATVTVSTGVAGVAVALTATAENIASASVDLMWEARAYGLVDLNKTGNTIGNGVTTSLDIIKLSSYTLNLMVADQWFNVPTDGTYRLNVTGEGVVARYEALAGGKATITATDTGVFGPSMDAVIVVERLAANGTSVASSTTHNFNANLSTKYKVNVGAAGTTLHGNTVVASVAVAKKALVEIDKRTSTVATPAYANNLVLNGSVVEAATSAGKVGATVTVSGPSNILFEQGNVAKRGSLTFNTAANGKFELIAYSTTAQKDTVVTFTAADGASETIKVTFTGIGVGEGTSLVVTTPAAVQPASTFQVKAKLTDAFGNAVTASAGRIKVTYTGAGIVFGTLPTETDANGELQFSVLLGSNDTGSISVTVSYDQNGNGLYTDVKDLNSSKTIAITASGTVAAAGKVNVGSFNGKLVIYATGLDGAKISWKVAGKWAVANASGSLLNRFDRPDRKSVV